jgi:hypothetical protein
MREVPAVTHEPPTWAAMNYILHNLRPRDHQEIMGLRWNDDINHLCEEFMEAIKANPYWRVYHYYGEPVAVVGYGFQRPGVMTVGAFGTSAWPIVARVLTRDSYRELIPGMIEAGMHRAESYVLAEHHDTIAWIKVLGGKFETTLHQYGRNREDYVLMTWLRDDVLRTRPGLMERAKARYGGPGRVS